MGFFLFLFAGCCAALLAALFVAVTAERLGVRATFFDRTSGRVRDPQLLYASLYRFWAHRGLWGAFSVQLAVVLNSVVLLGLVFVALFMVRWDNIAACRGQECLSVAVIAAPRLSHLSFWSVLLLCYAAVGALFALGVEVKKLAETWLLLRELHDRLLRHMRLSDPTPLHTAWLALRRLRFGRQGHSLLESDHDGEDAAGINGLGHEVPAGMTAEREWVHDLTWPQFLQVVTTRWLRHERGLRRAATGAGGADVDELQVLQVMLRTDNYLIALYSNHFVRPWSALWLLDDAVVKHVVKSFIVDGRVVDSTEKVYASLRLLVLLSPLLVLPGWCYFALKFGIRTIAVMKNNPSALFEYDWTPEARYHVRLYNELPHQLDSRLDQGSGIFKALLAITQEGIPFARIPHRAAAIVITLAFVVSFLNPTVIAVGTVQAVSLSAIVAWAFVTFNATNPYVHPGDREVIPGDKVTELSEVLHFEDASWRGGTKKFRDDATLHFMQPRALLILRQFVGIVSMPFALAYLLYYRKEEELEPLAEFLRRKSVWTHEVGSICVYSAGDTTREAEVHGAQYPLDPARGVPAPDALAVPDPAGLHRIPDTTSQHETPRRGQGRSGSLHGSFLIDPQAGASPGGDTLGRQGLAGYYDTPTPERTETSTPAAAAASQGALAADSLVLDDDEPLLSSSSESSSDASEASSSDGSPAANAYGVVAAEERRQHFTRDMYLYPVSAAGAPEEVYDKKCKVSFAVFAAVYPAWREAFMAQQRIRNEKLATAAATGAGEHVVLPRGNRGMPAGLLSSRGQRERGAYHGFWVEQYKTPVFRLLEAIDEAHLDVVRRSNPNHRAMALKEKDCTRKLSRHTARLASRQAAADRAAQASSVASPVQQGEVDAGAALKDRRPSVVSVASVRADKAQRRRDRADRRVRRAKQRLADVRSERRAHAEVATLGEEYMRQIGFNTDGRQRIADHRRAKATRRAPAGPAVGMGPRDDSHVLVDAAATRLTEAPQLRSAYQTHAIEERKRMYLAALCFVLRHPQRFRPIQGPDRTPGGSPNPPGAFAGAPEVSVVAGEAPVGMRTRALSDVEMQDVARRSDLHNQ